MCVEVKHAGRQLNLDLLRSTAIIFIVLSHLILLNSNTFGKYEPLVQFVRGYIGFVGLSIFFFISSYSLCLNKENLKSPIDFYMGRISRIYPMYFFSFIPYVTSISLYTLIICVFGLQGIFFKDNPGIPHVLWFIGVLLLFYLIYPLLTRGNILLRSFAILALFFLLRFLLDIIHINFFYYYMTFVTGIIVYMYSCYTIRALVLAITISFSSFLLSHLTNMATVNVTPFFLSISVALICYILATKYYYLFNKVDKIVYWISFSSYPVYLFHYPILSSMGVMALPFIFIAGYYIQKLDTIFKKTHSEN
jgi:peptidoglycan/LPS O-acetylase OafA/YrhL